MRHVGAVECGGGVVSRIGVLPLQIDELSELESYIWIH